MERILQKRYRVLRSLGRGGLGAVYLCDDLRLPGRQWALKQMNSPQPELFEKFRASFAREAGTLSQLRHPNLPDLVDFFEEGEDLFLVMEYVEGENLAEYVRRRGPLDEREAFNIGRTLLGILEYLHQRTPPIIFRDLKPENVMITTEGRVKLIDFGLARRFAPDKRVDTLPSGSVGYAAPEQWDDQGQTDARSDIYAWGATLAYLLSGKIPSPVFPMAALRESASLSPAARAILDKCTRARATDRYADVRAVSADVRQLRDGGENEREERERIPPAVVAGRSAAALSETGPGPYVDTIDLPPAPGGSVPPPPLPAAHRPWREGAGRRWGGQGPTGRASVVLLVLATLFWFVALDLALPRRAPVEASPSPAAARPGVVPYRQAQADPKEREKARALYRQGRWAEAIAALDALVTQTPQDAQMHILAANAYIFLQKDRFTRIPFIGSDSGVDAFDSSAHLFGLALAQDTINKRGGIRGHKVVVDVYDDRSQVSTCLQVAQGLVRDAAVKVVLGPTNSQRELAIAPIFNVAHVSLVAPTASSRAVWEAGPYIFTASDSRTPRVRGLARYMAAQGVKNVAILGEGTSRLSNEMQEAFAETMRAQGVATSQLPPFEEGQTDFTAQVQAAAQLKPDLIFFADYRPNTISEFARQLRASGSNVRLCAQTIAFNPELIEQGGDAVQGLMLCEYFHPELETSAMKAFMAAFRRKFGDLTPPYAVANTFDAFMAVAAALEHADTRQEVRDYLVSHPAFDGISGRFAFGKRLDARPLWLIEVRDGRFHLVGPPPTESGS